METTQDTSAQTAAPAVNPLERRLDMSVPLGEIEREVEQQLKRIAKTAKMAGFRPGKVPLKLVEKMYGGEARSEAIGAAIDKAFNELVRSQNLRIAGQPRVEPRQGNEEGKLEFTAIFEVYPEFQIADVSAKTIEKPVLTVTQAEVDKTIEVLRKQRTTYAPVDRPSAKGDRLIVDFTGRKNGEEFPGGKATDYPVFVGGGMMLPEFEAALEGMKAGEEKTFDVKFPDDYHAKDLAGQQVQFTVVVKKVEEPRLPDVDADFARALGIKDGDVAKLREEVKTNLEREVAKRLRGRVKEQAMNVLLEANPIDVPQSLVQAEAQQMAERALEDLKARNPQMKDMPVEASWFLDQAARRVKLGLIIAELVKSQNLHVKPEQVRAVVDEFAATFEEPQEVVRWYYSKPEQLAQAEALAMENNVVDWVLAHAQVVDKPVAFDELMGAQA
ncbi:MAG: trigger factor [Rhodocyclaceae bacterium]|jgi:trigger factor|nr:trigger factor [Rhodocyclaceae bacterium]